MTGLSDNILNELTNVRNLKEKVRARVGDADQAAVKEVFDKSPVLDLRTIKQKAVLKGHAGKIYSMSWCGPSRPSHLVSGSQDGRLLVWDAKTANKLFVVPLRSAWMMTCSFSSSGNFVASGGLDNICSVFSLVGTSSHEPVRVARELQFHSGYLSCCRFVSDSEILTTSGDTTCILWDVEASKPVHQFKGHSADVMSVSIAGNDSPVFVTGACDASILAWDKRVKKHINVFVGHDADVNSVAFMKMSDNTFSTGSDDGTCKLWDMRIPLREIKSFGSDLPGITCVDFSLSGRVLFAGSEDFTASGWDVLKDKKVSIINGHDNRVASLGVSADGLALCTASWDRNLKIWSGF